MLIFILAILMLQFTSTAAASPPAVISVQSLDVPPYNEALQGFKSVCRTNIQKIVLSEFAHDDLVKKISSVNPDLIVAIGPDALQSIKSATKAPIVYLMILDPGPMVANAPDITGVSMNIAQEKQVAIIRSVLPNAARIGLVYNPEQTDRLVKRGQKAAEESDMVLLTSPVRDPREVPSALTNMNPIPDALWLLPDISVITPDTLEFIFSFTLSNKMPLVLFSERYLALGAFMSISFDLFDMGRQGGEMANQILSGKPVETVPPVEAQKTVITLNKTVAEKLGIPIHDITLPDINIIE
ncbi:MAG: ABC transporter substrate-binding protein [Desulfobacterales bacterium]|jgi:putative ABC transport system substrate-binding protein|nr:ABC transporter substrate-binding protein [Desulfobacterales bacterium]